jgi:hopanoid biosynthesis associated protein HpnK
LIHHQPVRPIRLVVNADDFGTSEEVNEAVIRAFREGVLKSCSLIVTGSAFDHAIRLAKGNRGLAVGIHLVTIMGRPVLPGSQIPNLVDEEGNFLDNPRSAGLKYYFSKQARLELRRELAAQFEKFKSTCLELSHIDSHLHMHVHPVIFDEAVKLGERYGVRRMRVPEDELRAALRFDRNQFYKKALFALLFTLLARRMKKKLEKRKFVFPRRVYGNLQTGRMSEEYFLHALENLRAETNEIYFHPAVYDTSQLLSDEQRQCLVEFEALTSKRVSQRLRDSQIKLTNYFELDLDR